MAQGSVPNPGNRWGDVVNAGDFNANPSAPSATNTIAIQAAIDYAYATGKQTIFIPPGAYNYDPPLFLDAPGNLRASLTNPTIFGFSLRLLGGSLTASTSQGTVLKPTNDTVPALWVGTGAGMTVDGVFIQGPSPQASAALMNPNGIGIAIAGGNSGSTQTLIQNCKINAFYTGIKTGANIDALCDSVTLRKVWVETAYRGFWVGQTQNFIIDLDECSFQADNPIYNPQQLHINIRGGNYRCPGAALAIFGISGTSGLTKTADGSYTFTTSIASPDALMASGLVYTRCAIKTANFGIVPVMLVGYSNGTAIFRLLDSWYNSHFANLDLIGLTDLQAELAAATQVFVSSAQTIFTGAVYAQGVHIESDRPHVLLDTLNAPSNQQPIVLDRIRYNNDPAAGDLAFALGSGTLIEAAYLIQQSHPWMTLTNYPVTLRDSFVNDASLAPIDGPIIDGNPAGAQYYFERNVKLFAPNMRWYGPNQNDESTNDFEHNRYKGMGQFDRSPFLTRTTNGNNGTNGFIRGSDNNSPFTGWRPSPWVFPRLSPLQFATVSAALSAAQFDTYPLINGGAVYQVMRYDAASAKLVRSSHHFLSWGQSVPANWTYKGASNVVLMNDVSRMVAGLYIGLSLSGVISWFVVMGVYAGLSYVTVTSIGDGMNVQVNPGNKVTIYSGSSILQEPYAFTSVSLQ